jgi:hypothetical protein
MPTKSLHAGPNLGCHKSVSSLVEKELPNGDDGEVSGKG